MKTSTGIKLLLMAVISAVVVEAGIAGQWGTKTTEPTSGKGKSLAVSVKDIRYRLGENGKEYVFIEFDRYYLPRVQTLPGKRPRIVLDIAATSSYRKEWQSMSVNGKLVRRIRSGANRQKHTLRIVLDMTASKDYFVQPTFSAQENTYILEVSEQEAR